MSRFTLTALTLLAYILVCTPVAAQGPAKDPTLGTDKSFKLLRDDTGAGNDLDLATEEVEAWDPTLKSGAIQVSLGIGFMNLTSTLLQHDQIIYKYNTTATYWGNVKMTGESAFAPTIRVGYNLNDWLALEGWSGVSISKYSTEITNARSRKNELGAPVVDNPEILEFDPESRSLITLQAGVNLVWYPLSMSDPHGRWHPYLTGGAGNMWYDMNSNYTKGTSTALDLNFGGGIRLLADRNVSVRIEVLMHRNDLEWTPADFFTELNEGTTKVPLNEYPVLPDGSVDERPVTFFETNAINMLHWSIGVQGSF